jgi:hypothetical protein
MVTIAVLLLPLAVITYLVRGERWSTDLLERSPMELVRYAERRLIGHPRLQSLFGPALDMARQLHEREPPPNLPTLGKGQQAHALRAAGYDAAGRPRQVSSAAPKTVGTPPAVVLSSVESLTAAMLSAAPGQVLEVAPGSYTLSRNLATGNAGSPEQPITLRAAKPGTVEFVLMAPEGVRVTQPYWVFENLNWRGACPRHDDCEHAFHIAGRARGTTVLNNRSQDFNVHFKINGENGAWPDDGLLQFNSMVNLVPRVTDLPVDVVNVNGASGWQIIDNHMQRIVKVAGNRTSYGLCIKGAAQQTRIERNLVVCTPERISQPGLRVGISLGCGGSGGEYCRDGRCEVEAADSAVVNNVVAHCNDFGIDLNRARDVLVAHNTLVNTAGIDARRDRTRAVAVGNLLEGRLRNRDAAVLEQRDNTRIGSLDLLLNAPDALDLRWNEASDGARATPETERDFCGQRRPPLSPPGATVRPNCEAAAPIGTGAPAAN